MRHLQYLNTKNWTSLWKKTIEEPLHMSTVEKSERRTQDQDQRCQSGTTTTGLSSLCSVSFWSRSLHWKYWSRSRVGQQHGGQQLSQESVVQLKQLDRAACVFCGTTRSRRGNRCSHCKKDTETRDISAGYTFQDRRCPILTKLHATRSQFLQVNPWMTAHFHAVQFETLLLQNETGSCPPIFAGPLRWSPEHPYCFSTASFYNAVLKNTLLHDAAKQ